MRLFERMSTLLRADAHGVLDQLEERGLLLKQQLREAELALDHKRARATALDEELRGIGAEIEQLTEQLAALDEDVELALAGDREELARFAIRRLLPRRRALEGLRARQGELGEQRSRLADALATQQEQFEALRVQVRARLAREAPGPCWPEAAEAGVPDAEIDLELLRRRSARGRG